MNLDKYRKFEIRFRVSLQKRNHISLEGSYGDDVEVQQKTIIIH